MKKIISLLLVAAVFLGLAACGNTKTPAKTTEGVTKIAMLLPFVGDQSYMDVTYNGLKLVQEKFGDKVETKLIEMGTDEAGYESAFLQACNDGYDIIISGNFQYEPYLLAAAKQFPDIKFINYEFDKAELNSIPNVYGIGYASEEIGYLAGLVAAAKSESGIVGAIGGMENPGIKQFLAGFIEGAMDVNPDVRVITGFVGDFTDTGKAKEIALNMNKDGADVIFHAAGGAGNGLFEAAAEAKFWAIGVDSDQFVALSSKPELANTILTSGLKKCDQTVLAAVTAAIDGTLKYGTQETFGYTKDGVGLAVNEQYTSNMTPEQIEVVNSFIAKLESGETVVTNVSVDMAKWDILVAEAK